MNLHSTRSSPSKSIRYVRTEPPPRHKRAESQPEAEPMDPLEMMRRWNRGESERLAKERSSFHSVYAPDDSQRRAGLLDGFLWLAERLFVGAPPSLHRSQSSSASSLSVDASLDEETDEPEPKHSNVDAEELLLKTSQENGWQRCPAPGCGHMIELTEGCMRIKCRCGTKFCYGCGEPWKTCSCPLWNDEEVRQSYDDEDEPWEVVDNAGPSDEQLHDDVSMRATPPPPPPPRYKIPYFFEEDGITMPGGLFTMVPTREEIQELAVSQDLPVILTDSPVQSPTSSGFGEDALDETEPSHTCGAIVDEPQTHPAANPGDSLDLDDQLTRPERPRHLADMPPNYSTLDPTMIPTFPIPDASDSTNNLHDYGYGGLADGKSPFEAYEQGRMDSPETNETSLVGQQNLSNPTDDADKSILEPSIRRSRTPNILDNPEDQDAVTAVRKSARSRFSIDGINSRRDLTDKDPPPRNDTVLDHPEDQARMNTIRNNAKTKKHNKTSSIATSPSPSGTKEQSNPTSARPSPDVPPGKDASAKSATASPTVVKPPPKPAWGKSQAATSSVPKSPWGGAISKPSQSPSPPTPGDQTNIPDPIPVESDTSERSQEVATTTSGLPEASPPDSSNSGPPSGQSDNTTTSNDQTTELSQRTPDAHFLNPPRVDTLPPYEYPLGGDSAHVSDVKQPVGSPHIENTKSPDTTQPTTTAVTENVTTQPPPSTPPSDDSIPKDNADPTNMNTNNVDANATTSAKNDTPSDTTGDIPQPTTLETPLIDIGDNPTNSEQPTQTTSTSDTKQSPDPSQSPEAEHLTSPEVPSSAKDEGEQDEFAFALSKKRSRRKRK